MRLRITRFLRGLVVGFAVLTAGFVPVAMADAPSMARKQAPGYYRFMHGEFEVTVLFDGAFDVDSKLLLNATQPELRQLLAQNDIDGTVTKTAVNAWLINTGKNLVLVDGGCGALFGPKMGKLMENLKASGYTPEQVDTILLTHMHGDHIGGLVDATGKILFPNATVYANQAENDFWLSDKNAAAAKTDMLKNGFKMAQSSSAPYRDAKKWKTFRHKDEVLPGILAISIPGHTPGHTMYRLKSGELRLFIFGDVVHNYAVQFARPEVAIEFDVDPKQAVITRYKLFDYANKYQWLVAGAHLPYPGIGYIRSKGDGSYAWIPIQLLPE
ncbi:MAG: MBL fold metallo-hydrolase [Burkholderiaceae bacterium]|jgi:glyoxylase-like metal-dependent hydrolase (beta-lactamase superfamily II)|nr:MBL fold metallo-hydrolase [Burkholderiaceae bacterium]